DLRDADDFRSRRWTGIAAARPRARLDEALEPESQAEAVARHRDRVDRRWVLGMFGGRLDVAGRARVEAHRPDDPLAVLQLEKPLDRLAVAGRRRHVDEAARVRDAE